MNTNTLLQQLIQYSPSQENNLRLRDFLSRYLSSLGLSFQIIDKDYIYAGIGQGSPHLMFVSYYDTLPIRTENWSIPPYQGTIKEGKIYGRGSISKGCLACALKAVESILSEKSFSYPHISFLLSAQGTKTLSSLKSSSLKSIFKENNIPTLCVSATPQNQNYIGEKISIGAKGCVIFCIKSFSLSGHPALQAEKQNSLHNMIDFLAKIKTYPLDSGNEYFEPSRIQILSIESKNGQDTNIPEETQALVGLYYNSDHHQAEIVEWMKKNIVFSKGEFELSYRFGAESYINKPSSMSALLQSSVQNIIGSSPRLSGNDIPNFAWKISSFCPLLGCGLPSYKLMSRNEYILQEDAVTLEAIYRELIKNFFTNAPYLGQD